MKLVKEKSTWQIRAIVGRLAKPGLFVTNLSKGGLQISGTSGLRHTFSPALVKLKKRKMINLAYKCTQILEKRYPGIRQLGFDFGLDRSGNVWIFEVNTRPQ